ncbi:hypothetical protein [Pelagerythrobacter marensis]|uniref:Uncharacterized protein n=1 Tax=Pelagerythrobacter marensis TaxID=543877 RepID=A0A0G3X9J7_9SPHN|nr:hypothetical protein [Pelagerythrobacter marensis]AKM07289.1 hypothetical protein AM2010_1215 [Pelagerythrobacter marensis]
MRMTILTGVAALALAVPVAAQQTTAEAHAEASHAMNATQQTSYDAWPADRQAAYDGWPADIQGYFWSLSPQQQRGWWALTDEQRVQIHAMTPDQRNVAWSQIAAQLSGAGSATPTSTGRASTSPATTGNMQFVSSEMVQNAPAPKADYPICSREIQDSCINPREAGKNYGNVPLDYWPGRPASEIEGPLPAEEPKG